MAEQSYAIDVGHPPSAVLRIVNPALAFLLRTPLAGPARKQLMVLSFTGRKTGRPYSIPLSAPLIDHHFYALTDKPWKQNFRDGAPAQVVYNGKTTAMRGVLWRAPRYAHDGTEIPRTANTDARGVRRSGRPHAPGGRPVDSGLVAISKLLAKSFDETDQPCMMRTRPVDPPAFHAAAELLVVLAGQRLELVDHLVLGDRGQLAVAVQAPGEWRQPLAQVQASYHLERLFLGMLGVHEQTVRDGSAL